MNVIVIGGGPAGLMAACQSALQGHKVTVIEKNNRPARKLMITGKGRCNLTNLCDEDTFIKNVVTNPRFLYSAIHAFTPQNTMGFFAEQGLSLKVERGNRVFPVSDKAVDVVDTLVHATKKAGCTFVQDSVSAIQLENGCITGVRGAKKDYSAQKVIIATGGLSYPKTGSTGDGYTLAESVGHTIIPPRGSLVPLVEEGGLCASLQGLALKNINIKVFTENGKQVFEEFGELLFTHFGLSGPVILSASGHMKPKTPYRVSIDLKPALDEKQLDLRLQRDFEKHANRDFVNSLTDLLPSKMVEPFARCTDIPFNTKAHQITRVMRGQVLRLLKAFSVTVIDFRPVDEAIVTAGGVSVKEVSPKTMESRLAQGLFFAGEVLDVDAYTGGFNLQIAFSTGYLAGQDG